MNNYRLNLDHVVSRLTCHAKNFHPREGGIFPYTCKFRKDSRCDLLAVGTLGGCVTLYDTSVEASESTVGSIYVRDSAISDICWLPDKCQLIACSGSHVTLLDMCQLQILSSFKNHTTYIDTVDVCYEQSAIFAVGTSNGSVNVWDTRESNAKPALSFRYAHGRKLRTTMNKKPYAIHRCNISIQGVAFQDSTTLASCSCTNEYIKIWDLRRICVTNQPSFKYQMKYEKPSLKKCGYTSIVFDSTYKNLYACRADNQIIKFDCHSYSKADAVYKGCTGGSYEQIALSSDDQYLVCGSINGDAYIWNTSNSSSPILTLSAHDAGGVADVCWSPYDCTKIVTCGVDDTLAIWKVSNLNNEDDIGVRAKAEPYEVIDC